jgi:hypothetical protein
MLLIHVERAFGYPVSDVGFVTQSESMSIAENVGVVDPPGDADLMCRSNFREIACVNNIFGDWSVEGHGLLRRKVWNTFDSAEVLLSITWWRWLPCAENPAPVYFAHRRVAPILQNNGNTKTSWPACNNHGLFNPSIGPCLPSPHIARDVEGLLYPEDGKAAQDDSGYAEQHHKPLSKAVLSLYVVFSDPPPSHYVGWVLLFVVAVVCLLVGGILLIVELALWRSRKRQNESNSNRKKN